MYRIVKPYILPDGTNVPVNSIVTGTKLPTGIETDYSGELIVIPWEYLKEGSNTTSPVYWVILVLAAIVLIKQISK